jgi:sugar phosphate permease
VHLSALKALEALEALILSFFPQRYLILVIFNAVYFFVYFHRISTGVLAPYLMEDFQASGASLGGMSSAYFYPYALSQPVVGIFTDRFGARKVVTACTFIEFLGALIFALAPTLLIAALGRALIGLGAAGVFVPALKVFLPWFGPQSFGRMNVILLAVGNVGAIVAATPLAWFIQNAGWRSSFFIISGILLLLTFFSWAYIRDTPPGYTPSPETQKTASSKDSGGFADILRKPFFWIMAALFFAYGGPLSTFQGLWGYPYLIDVFGYSKLEASNLIMVIAIGVIAGGPVMGYLTDKTFAGKKRPFLSVCITIQVLNWGLIAWVSHRFESLALGLVFFVMGMMLAGTLAVVWAIVREESPPERLGTAMGFLNPAPFLGVAAFQPLTGYLMDRVGKAGGAFPLQAYQNAFNLCLLSVSAAMVISIFLMKMKKAE